MSQVVVNINNSERSNRPMYQLKTNRGLLKLILLSFVTFGIYPLVVFSSISSDINLIASPHDGRKTMHFCLLLFIVAPLTCGIGALVWYHRISDRIGRELTRRGHSTSFSSATFWLWNVLGSLIAIGPLVYVYKLLHSMNDLCADYNYNG